MSDEIGKFLVAVGALITKPTGEILMIKRSESKDFSGGIWEYPMGRLNQFEEPEEGLFREIMEEIGIKVEIIKPLSIFHIFRGEEIAENELVGVIYWCKLEDTEQEIILSEEHTEYKWCKMEEALELVPNESMRKDILRLIEESRNLTI